MKRIWFLSCAAALLASAAVAQEKPDFTGTWTLDTLRSRLDKGRDVKALTMKIEQNEPNIKLQTTRVPKKGEAVQYTLDLNTDGTEVQETIDGQPCTASATWGPYKGERLIVKTKCTGPNGEMTRVREMKVGSERKMMTTVLTATDRTGAHQSYEFYTKE